MAKRKSKFNLGYFCSFKNIVPIILVVIIVFLVFNILQNNSFNPFIEGNDNLNQIIDDLASEIDSHKDGHEDLDEHYHTDGVVAKEIKNFIEDHKKNHFRKNDNNHSKLPPPPPPSEEVPTE
jgi:hypothetical protein